MEWNHIFCSDTNLKSNRGRNPQQIAEGNPQQKITNRKIKTHLKKGSRENLKSNRGRKSSTDSWRKRQNFSVSNIFVIIYLLCITYIFYIIYIFCSIYILFKISHNDLDQLNLITFFRLLHFGYMTKRFVRLENLNLNLSLKMPKRWGWKDLMSFVQLLTKCLIFKSGFYQSIDVLFPM